VANQLSDGDQQLAPLDGIISRFDFLERSVKFGLCIAELVVGHVHQSITNRATPKKQPGVQNRTAVPRWISDYLEVKKSQLTPKQISSVPCPTCGVTTGERCLLHSGGKRSEPHVDRKLLAVEAIEGIPPRG
jgi:hypothetical protein